MKPQTPLRRRLTDLDIRFTVRAVSDEEAGYTPDPAWPHTTWLCTFRRTGVEPLVTGFRMGLGHTQQPKADEVMDSLLSEANGIDGTAGFEDWAENYGLNPDSRNDEKLYRTCVEQTARLRVFLHRDFDALAALERL